MRGDPTWGSGNMSRPLPVLEPASSVDGDEREVATHRE